MNKIKIILVSTAIILAISTAFATRPCVTCTDDEQYYYSGGSFIPAGDYGFDFYCISSAGVCSYYKPNPIFQPNYYAPCRWGTYVVIP